MKWVLWCLPLLPTAVIAAQDSTRHALPTVIVTATREPVLAHLSPVRSQVISGAAMREMGAETVADVLTAHSELYIRRYSGGLATLSQRGQSASSTLILLDGHRIASPSLGQLDLSLLPSLILSSVEIAAGPGSPAYGRDAMGGIVHLRSSSNEQDPAGSPLQLKVSAGSYGKRVVSLMATHRRGRIIGRLAAEYNAFNGNYRYRNKALFPPRDVSLSGSEMMRHSAYGSLTFLQADGQWTLALWYNDAERGLPAIHSTLPSLERQWDRHVRAWSNGSRNFSWGTLRISGLGQMGMLRYHNGRMDIDDTGRTLIGTATLEAALKPQRRWRAGIGLEGGYGQATHPSLANNTSEKHYASFLHATASYGPFVLYPALRQDVYVHAGARPQMALSPRLGTNVHLRPNLYAKASIGRAFRVPTFNDRYWQPGGNPQLRPERSWTADTGMRADGAHISAEVTAFVTQNTDEIVWSPTQENYWTPDNMRRRVLRGLETSFGVNLRLGRHSNTTIRIHYTYTTTDRAANLRLIPQNQVKGHVTLRLFARESAYRLTLSSSARYTGAQIVSSEDSVNAFTIIDNHLWLHLPIGAHALALGLSSENTLGTRFEFLPSQPMPPRLLRLDVTLTL